MRSNLAGDPAHSWPAGTLVPLERTDPAARAHAAPRSHPDATVLPTPIETPSATFAPSTIALAPMNEPKPTVEDATTAPSLTTLSSPIFTAPLSPCRTLPYQADAFFSIVTAPSSEADGATNPASPIAGTPLTTLTAVQG